MSRRRRQWRGGGERQPAGCFEWRSEAKFFEVESRPTRQTRAAHASAHIKAAILSTKCDSRRLDFVDKNLLSSCALEYGCVQLVRRSSLCAARRLDNGALSTPRRQTPLPLGASTCEQLDELLADNERTRQQASGRASERFSPLLSGKLPP